MGSIVSFLLPKWLAGKKEEPKRETAKPMPKTRVTDEKKLKVENGTPCVVHIDINCKNLID